MITRWVFRNRHRDDEPRDIILLHDYRAMYFPIPKVACSSLRAVCVDLLNIQLPADAWKPELFYTDKYDHLVDTRELRASRSELHRYPDYRGFAFVRNPWDRLVSCYAEKIRDDGDTENFVGGVSKVLLPYGVFEPGMSFRDFAHAVAEIPDAEAEPHFRSQHTFITDDNGATLVDFVGRFSSLAEDFGSMMKTLGASAELPHLLPSRHPTYLEYYDSSLRALIAERYAEDVERFAFTFER